MSTDPIGKRFRGPTPPPGLDRTVLSAAASRAGKPDTEGESVLPDGTQKSYSNENTDSQAREHTTMSDNIVFPCPACGTKYSVAPNHAGKKTKCKKCAAPITVPSPEVDSPTIVGTTRTIRRADIDTGAHARRRGAPQPQVDMGGGSSVLRRKGTVVNAPPAAAPASRSGRRHTHPPGHAYAPAGQPMPPGAYPPGMYPQRRKNKTPMIVGIVSGVVALVMIVVLIVVASNDGGGGGAAETDQQQVAGPPEQSEKERILEQLDKEYNNKAALDDIDRVTDFYRMAKERSDDIDFKKYQDLWAAELARKARREATSVELAQVALMLDDDGYDEARDLLEKAWKDMADNETATEEYTESESDGVRRRGRRATPLFSDVVTRLGWVEYTRPDVIDEYDTLDIKAEEEYSSFYDNEVKEVCRTVELYPPHVVEKLNEFEEKARLEYEDLINKGEFAIEARRAWIRFKHKYDTLAKVNRAEGKRAFSPKAMDRENEDFDDIWTYTYGQPFIVFVEKPSGASQIDDEFIESLQSKAALLRNLVDWFNKNLKDRFNLQRVKPEFNALQAEKESWPLEIVVLKDKETFEKFVKDVQGQPMPGARAYYSPLDEHVMTYDDRESRDEDTQWFNESVLIHETFHMLSDFYASKPMFSREEMQSRPRYANILVQEGLTDSVAGFSREGEGNASTYEFLELNHLRLRSFQNIYEMLENRTLFRIRDMIECRNYGQIANVAFDRAQELEINPGWAAQAGMGIFYPTACQASYFFHHYQENGAYPYREKWWTYIGEDYQGNVNVSHWRDNRGIAAFERVFEIESDEDWDELESKWLEYTLELDPADVGKSGADEIDGPTDEDPMEEQRSVRPGIPPRGGITGPHARPAAYAGRDD